MRSPVKKFMDRLQKPSVHKNKKDILVNTNSKDLIPFCYIKVSDDFGLLPSGNILSDGPLNFESFEIVFGQELKTSPKSIIDFKDCLAVGSSFLNQLAIFAINNNLKDKLNIVSDNNVVSDKYKKYLKTNKAEAMDLSRKFWSPQCGAGSQNIDYTVSSIVAKFALEQELKDLAERDY